MMKELRKSRIYSLGDDELLIEAQAPIEGHQKEYRRMAFKASQVDYLYEIDDKTSGMVLANGIAIPVALAFAELKKQVYTPDLSTGANLDLSLVTGAAVAEARALRLSKEFNPAAEAPKAEAGELNIVMYAHLGPTDKEFRRVVLPESLIDHFEAHSQRKDTEIYIALKDTLDDWDEMYAAVSLPNFTWHIENAKKNGEAQLDLTDVTRPKNTTSLRM